MQQRIGLIGLGIMGSAMAANIIKAGHRLTIHNRTSGKADSLLAAGAMAAASPRQLAEDCDIIILMLTGPEAIDSILHGENGLLAARADGRVVINMSTVPPTYARQLDAELGRHGIICIDAPVSGSKLAAEAATLVILAGGPEQAIRQMEPLLLCMGKKVVHCGEAGSGSGMKLAVNLLLAIMMEGLAEATNFAEKSGIAAATFLQVVGAGPLACTLFSLKEGMLESGSYPAQFPFRHMAKDMGFVLETAAQIGADLPAGREVAELFSPDAPADLLDMDFSAVRTLLNR